MQSILIIDDDAEYRRGLKISLEGKNYKVLEAVNGREGLLLLGREQVDVVITDIVMPEREGIDVIQAMRRQRPELKIIAVSAAQPSILRIAHKLGANASFPKSIPFDQIAEMVKDVARG
jgi:YesN/AraC family two-component response regulator